MRVQFIDNVSVQMAAALSSLAQDSRDMRMAVAFVSNGGLELIKPALTEAIHGGAAIEFLVGLDMRVTEPQAMRSLLHLSRTEANVALYCLGSLNEAGIYHPKLYVSRGEKEVAAIVGSSNLTEGGLKRNVEVNIFIQAESRDEIVADIYATYNRLKFHPQRVVPDEELLDLYAELRLREQSMAKDVSLRQLRKAFRQKAKSLRRPKPTRKDLIGWLELVYDVLPDGEFTNSAVYASESEFRHQYPDNLNIRAKVRQQLQVLTAMGLIEHLARGHWRKL